VDAYLASPWAGRRFVRALPRLGLPYRYQPFQCGIRPGGGSSYSALRLARLAWELWRQPGAG
ncbi:MAG: hypothetical protein AB1758_13870, partial [Candidatus Eremiobacterota bacterium]